MKIIVSWMLLTDDNEDARSILTPNNVLPQIVIVLCYFANTIPLQVLWIRVLGRSCKLCKVLQLLNTEILKPCFPDLKAYVFHHKIIYMAHSFLKFYSGSCLDHFHVYFFSESPLCRAILLSTHLIQTLIGLIDVFSFLFCRQCKFPRCHYPFTFNLPNIN